MRARLNKQQAKMLLDGKLLTVGRTNVGVVLTDRDSDLKMVLEDFANGGEVMSEYDIFVNIEKRCFEIEKKRMKWG